MNGGAQRTAEGSLVRGTQWSTLLPKKVRPNASPWRILRNSSIAFIDASYRVPSPSGVVMLPETSTQNSMFVKHPPGLRRTELLRTGQKHDHQGQDQGRQRLGELQNPGPDPARALLPVVERQRDAPSRYASRPSRARAAGSPAAPARRDRQSSRPALRGRGTGTRDGCHGGASASGSSAGRFW